MQENKYGCSSLHIYSLLSLRWQQSLVWISTFIFLTLHSQCGSCLWPRGSFVHRDAPVCRLLLRLRQDQRYKAVQDCSVIQRQSCSGNLEMDYPQGTVGSAASIASHIVEQRASSAPLSPYFSSSLSFYSIFFFVYGFFFTRDWWIFPSAENCICMCACWRARTWHCCLFVLYVSGRSWWYQCIDEHSHKTLMCWCKLWVKTLHWRMCKGFLRQFLLTPRGSINT